MKPQPNIRQAASRVKWQWKSNSDPWSKTEEPQWTSYSPEYNYLIEKAFHEKQKEVDLGDYSVSPQDMIQKKKGNIPLQRPIRRREDDDEEEEMDIRSERYFETELPKTINKIFGSLSHFISFFSKRNPEILDLTNQFQEFEQTIDLNGLNKIICPQLIHCLEVELLRPIEDHLKDDSITKLQKKMKLDAKRRSEQLISLFQREFISFEEFYGSILKSYTMNTGLYMNLNRYLRNEDWIAIENLLPYTICLCKAFFSFKSSVSMQEELKVQETESSMILYRGTALDEFALSSYLAEKAPKLFSWNSVTSTSTNRQMAEKFMYLSADIEKKIHPVLFIIEISLANELAKSEHLKWIDIHQYSALKNEFEVILPPGSPFELGEVFTDKEKRTTIKLKLKHDVNFLAHEGLIMQGALQSEMLNDKQVKVVCLEGEELSEALRSLYGNKLFEEIEFCLCTFDHKSLEELLSTLPTLGKVKRLKFLSCKYEVLAGITSIELQNLKNCNILEIEIFEAQDFYKILCNPNEDYGYWTSLRKLNIDFRYTKESDFEFQNIRYLIQLTSLAFDFQNNKKLTNKGVENLASQALKYLTQLSSLTLNFRDCRISDEGVSDLAVQGLKHLTKLVSLSLNFSSCHYIQDEGVLDLAFQGLKDLIQLASLGLNFWGCEQISDEAVNDAVSHITKHLTQLTSLSLVFRSTKEVGDRYIELPPLSLQYFAKLKTQVLPGEVIKFEYHKSHLQEKQEENPSKLLNRFSPLRFIRRKAQRKLTSFDGQQAFTQPSETSYLKVSSSEFLEQPEEKIENMLFSMMKSTWNYHVKSFSAAADLTSFENLFKAYHSTSLTLKFSYSFQITDEGINLLASQGLKHLTQLVSLSLNFTFCSTITDEGLNHLASQGLKYLTQLTSLDLDFDQCHQISNTGIKNLASQGLKYLTQLNSLSLNFSPCRNLTDEGMKDLAVQGLQYLTQLTSLSLNFHNCINIVDEGIYYLASQGLQNLTQLATLSLTFSSCPSISDMGVNQLASQGLKYLTQLASFCLNIWGCEQITDDGVNNLISHVTKHLTKLTLLTLNFSNRRSPEFTISNIVRVLNYFGFRQEEEQEEEIQHHIKA